MKWWYPVLSIGIFTLVGMIVAYIDHYKTHKKFLNPLSYFKLIGITLLRVPKSFFGIKQSKDNIIFDRADFKYATLTLEQAKSALNYASDKMLEDDMSIENYIHRQVDCDDYSMAKCHFAKRYITKTFSELIGNKGIPIGMIGYIRKDGKGHQIIQVWIEDSRVFYDAYAEDRFKEPLKLTEKEIDTIHFDIM